MSDYLPANPPQPQTTPEARPVLRSFPTDTSLASFVKQLIEENVTRMELATRITSKLNSERPHDPARLTQAGLSWKSNFSTRPLNTLISKVVGRFPRAVANARYLTSSALPGDVPNAIEKTEFFRSEFTTVLRSDPRFSDFVESIASEDVTFGWCAAGWLDEDSWFPEFWRQDQMFVPVGTKQISRSANVLVVKQALLPSEAFVQLDRANQVEDGRWNLPLFAEAINKALPELYRVKTGEYSRLWEELVRGLQLMSSYAGANRVALYHVLAQELTGKISHYILDGEYRMIFQFEDRFANMDTVAHFFAFEKADGTLMGSKGIGRAAYSMAAVIDRTRNDAVDRLQMSGKIIAQAPVAQHVKAKLSVVGPFLLIDEGFQLSETRLEASPEASITLDQYLNQLLNEMTGSVSEKDFEGRERVTKAEVNARIAREAERSDDFLERWLRQFGFVLSGIQNRLLNPDMVPSTPGYEEAQALRARLLTRLTPEEIEYLRKSPALTAVQGLTPSERENIVSACIEGQGNPMYNQRALANAKVTAQVGPEFAKAVVAPEEDPTQVAEQTRLQMFENDILLNGQESPVSPRDAHALHIDVLLPVLGKALEEAVANPTAETIARAFATHGMQHVELAKQYGDKSPKIQEAEQALSQVLTQLDTLAKQAAAEAEAAQVDPAAAGVPPPAVPA